jgi:uncharacterized protein YndB with AHSA1/START domain
MSSGTMAQTNTEVGTVVLSFITPASTPAIWEALTEPAIVSQWFGTLHAKLRVGTETRLDFGDGDFFTLTVTRYKPLDELEYTWRFLGIAPQDTILWELTPQETGCLVTVRDRQPDRSPATVEAMREGWLDFTERLRLFLTTGTPTRYDWRREIDASIELTCGVEIAWYTLFSSELQSQWLPLNKPILDVGTAFVLTDGIEPSEVQITNVIWHPPHQVQYQLTHASWLQPTECLLKLTARGQGSLLTISHVGWEAIRAETKMQFQQRKRFCDFWIAALQQAQRLIL